MYVDIFDEDKMIKVNGLKPVTNPILFNKGNIPTTDGLLSYDIFGRTPKQRKETWAYIDLKHPFFHPLVYINLMRVDRRIEKIVNGTLRVKLDENGYIEADPKGRTGIMFLYNNWHKIKFKPSATGSRTRVERIDMITALSKQEIFPDKWLVTPPYYRDMNMSKVENGRPSVGEENELYAKLIRLTDSLRAENSGISIVGNSTVSVIQKLLVDIYNSYIDRIKGKGLFRKGVLGTDVDNACRLVISNYTYNTNSYKDMLVSFEYAGCPLDATIILFYPYISKWVKNLFQQDFFINNKATVVDKNGNLKTSRIKNAEEMISDHWIEKNIDSFVHSYYDRFKKIYVELEDGSKAAVALRGYDNKAGREINRPVTWTDILYMAATDVAKDKHILITRYPLTDYFNATPMKFRVTSTLETETIIINGVEYKHYPKVDLSMSPTQVSSYFIETLNMSNAYLQGYGADYDGDQVTVKGIYSKEANAEVNEHIYSTKNLLNAAGELVRTIDKEAVQTLYSLTRRKPGVYE